MGDTYYTELRQSKLQEYRAKLPTCHDVSESIGWRGLKSKSPQPIALVSPVVGKRGQLNHHAVYLQIESEPKLIVSAHFIKSQAIEVQAASTVLIKYYQLQGWKPTDYMVGVQPLAKFRQNIEELTGALIDGGEDPFIYMGNKSVLKVLKRQLAVLS
jgi:hypothetical protein